MIFSAPGPGRAKAKPPQSDANVYNQLQSQVINMPILIGGLSLLILPRQGTCPWISRDFRSILSSELDRKETPWFVRYMCWFNFIYIYVLCVHTCVWLMGVGTCDMLHVWKMENNFSLSIMWLRGLTIVVRLDSIYLFSYLSGLSKWEEGEGRFPDLCSLWGQDLRSIWLWKLMCITEMSFPLPPVSPTI